MPDKNILRNNQPHIKTKRDNNINRTILGFYNIVISILVLLLS